MTRVFGLLLIGSIFLASCSKKTHPAVSTRSKTPETHSTRMNPVTDSPAATVNNPVETPAPPLVAMASPMIVIDGSGKVITPRDKLPEDIAYRVDYAKITRSFTPVQRQNLIVRFKLVPPKVLYVPQQLASKSAKGSYVVYRKKFWYWKKEDGLFHLDETYYQ